MLYEKVFSEVKRVLKNNGTLLIEEPISTGTMQDCMKSLWDETLMVNSAREASQIFTDQFGLELQIK